MLKDFTRSIHSQQPSPFASQTASRKETRGTSRNWRDQQTTQSAISTKPHHNKVGASIDKATPNVLYAMLL